MADEAQTDGKKSGFFVRVLKALKKYFLILVVFVAVVIGLAFYMTRGVSDFGKTIISKLQAIDCDGIYKLVSTGFKVETPAAEWDAKCQGAGSVLSGKVTEKTAEVVATLGGTKQGVVTYHIEGSDQRTYLVRLDLIDEDGWKLLGLKSTEVVTEPKE